MDDSETPVFVSSEFDALDRLRHLSDRYAALTKKLQDISKKINRELERLGVPKPEG
jgi:hypothetical protein